MKDFLWPFYPLLAMLAFGNFVIFSEIFLVTNRSHYYKSLRIPILAISILCAGFAGDNILWSFDIWSHKMAVHNGDINVGIVFMTAIITKATITVGMCALRIFSWMLRENAKDSSLIRQIIGTLAFAIITYALIFFFTPL